MTNDLERIGDSLLLQAIRQVLTGLYIQKTQAETLARQQADEIARLKAQLANEPPPAVSGN
jgi:hypothetical protein